jgi:hypothetical protein
VKLVENLNRLFTPSSHLDLTHDMADQVWVAPWMRDGIGVVLLVEGDGRLGPSEPCQSGEGVTGAHLLLSDAALPAGFVGIGAPEDHEEALGLGELSVFLLGAPTGLLTFRASFWDLPCWPRVPQM